MVTCPHCDSARIEQMLDRTYESQATNTWYQCKNCRRMWSLPKLPAPPPRPGNQNSPES